MSKKNTLFNYFTKIDGGSKKENAQQPAKESVDLPTKVKKDDKKAPLSKKQQNGSRTPEDKGKKRKQGSKEKKPPTPEERQKKKRARIIESTDDDETPKKKKKKSTKADDLSAASSGDEWKGSESEESSSDDESEGVEESSEAEISAETSDSEDEKPRRKTTAAGCGTTKSSKSKSVAVVAPNILKENPVQNSQCGLQERSWAHLSYPFLQPNKIQDANRKPANHPDYNPHTLFVPSDFLKNLTPAMRQWWEIKSKHWDCVLFMKLGKFYELYHMDAVTGVNELGLIFMKHPDVAHSGFPEAGYARYSSVLVEKGYKVARIEQTETPDMMQERCKTLCAPTKFDRVVKREVCQITSKGTRMYLAIEGDAASADHAYLLAITEKRHGEDPNVTSYGICLVDTSIGSFSLGQFDDDRHKSALRMLLAHHPPAHILLNKATVGEETRSIVTSLAGSALVENLAADSEFFSASQTLKTLHEKNYFGIPENMENESLWPKVLVDATESGDERTPQDNMELALSALGGCLWYLTRSKLDAQLIASRQFTLYTPVEGVIPENDTDAPKSAPKYMILDATTLANMDVLYNAEMNGTEGTLLGKIDKCCTPFGKRLLRQWLCAPLATVDSIEARQKAVEALMKLPAETEQARKRLKELPDLERMLLRISVYGHTAPNHPDSRAIYYEDFSKKKIENLLSLLKGFKASVDIVAGFSDCFSECNAELLQRIMSTAEENPKGQFPDLSPLLEFFDSAFDHKEALNTGKLTPRSGIDPEFEQVSEKIKKIETKLQDHLREMKQQYGREVKYIGTDKKRFQLEVPEKSKVPSSFELTSSRKGFKRYYTPEAKALLSKLLAAEEEKKVKMSDINRRMFARFASSMEKWQAATQCLGLLDVLLSLAKYGQEESTCMPRFHHPSKEVPSFIDIRNGQLPTTTLSDFIPNDTIVGMDGVRLLLLSGPNMGGKSTLMRQLGLIVIMAQIGCPVPAEACSLTPADRIFTRLGAQDHILAGESTFFVEMSETSSILKHATQQSIVLVDELGRGTTTFDGAAIAAAVLERLIAKQSCCIFSTHYHFLVEQYGKSPHVKLVHMACMEEEEGDGVETVTFLYKIAEGACPSSHGFNAARLAGLPGPLVLHAKQQALRLQSYPLKVHLFRELMGLGSLDRPQLQSFLKQLAQVKKWGGLSVATSG